MTRAEAAQESQPGDDAKEDGASLDAFRPGSSAADDHIGGYLSDKAAARIPHKRLRTYRVVQLVVGPLARLLFRVEGIDVHKIPKRGPVITATNHASWFDPVAVVSCMHRPISALGKAYIFRGWLRTWFFEWLGGQIRIDRDRRGNLAAVNAAIAANQQGKLISIWPEGGRSPTGHLTRGKTGIARIALATGAPVYPIATIGAFHLKAKHKKGIQWGTRVRIVCGDPLTFEGDLGKQDDRETTRRVTDTIMLEVAKLMGADEEARYLQLLKEDVPPGELPLDRRDLA